VKKTRVLIPAILVGFGFSAQAQNQGGIGNGQLNGIFQIDAQYYNPDSLIGAPTVPEKALMNGWSAVNYNNGRFTAGIRYESYLNVLQGYPTGYKNTGIPYRYVTYNNNGLEITAGSSYEQFGSGLVLRSYEDRGLGYDNALDGIRVRYNPYKGIYLKGVWGRQRDFFSSGQGIVRGFDGEINLNQLFDSTFANCKTQCIIGGNFVSKYQLDQDPLLVLPQNVGTWSGRANVITNRFNFYGEFAYKINDPSIGNNYIYKPGNAAYFVASYAKKGLGISLGLNRVDNFGYRSDRSATGNQLMINYIPAMSKQHTYQLMAYYPYASQPVGQIGWQGEIAYKVKKGTKLGGKYGMDVAVNYSASYGLDTSRIANDSMREGYTVNSLGPGKSLLYHDFNIEVFKKFSPHVKAFFTYGNFRYNKNVIEGKANYPILLTHVVVAEVIWNINNKLTLRTDIEHMSVDKNEDFGNWALALGELTVGDHFFFAVMDQYNYNNYKENLRIHYFNGQVGYMNGTVRIVAGYGKQRAGIFCVGGVCRFVPASNGFTLSITSSF
jgi:Family of unknown function (DUF6029)